MGILIKNGRVIDAETNTDRIMDLYVQDGVIKLISEDIEPVV